MSIRFLRSLVDPGILLAVASVGMVAGGCFRQTTTTCADGTTCAGSMVCAPQGGGCATPGQITACRGIPEGAGCAAPGVEDGSCIERVCSSTAWSTEVVIGNQQKATEVALFQPTAAAYGPDGSLYIAMQNVIQRVDGAGVITTIAGTGDAGDGGDGGEATSAQLSGPRGLAVDGHGQVFIADTGNHRIRRIDAAGNIMTVAGTGQSGYSDGAATLSMLSSPRGLAVDGAGNLTIADSGNHRIRYVTTSGDSSIIVTRAGTGTAGFNGDLPQAINAQLNNPTAVAIDKDGNVFITDTGNHRVRKVSSGGGIATVAGTGVAGALGDLGSAALAQLNNPIGVALDGDDVLIADGGNKRIRRVVAGVISTAAGGGAGLAPDREGGEAANAILSEQLDVAADPDGGFVVVDSFGLRVRHVDTTGTIVTAAGNATATASNGGGAATSIQLVGRTGLSRSRRGGFIFTNFPSQTNEVDASGGTSTIAGAGPFGFSGDGGPAKAAGFMLPQGSAYDREGNLYISDVVGRRVRRIDANGIVSTVAGNGMDWSGTGDNGDGGPATKAPLGACYDVAVDRAGNLYLADFTNSRIRRVDRAGTITTVVGTTAGDSGDGGDATRAQIRNPISIAIDGDDTMYIADSNNGKIRRVKDGKIYLFAGGGTGPDGSPAISARVQRPLGIALGDDHSLLLVEEPTARVRRIDPSGIISTVAGTGEFMFRGDGGPAKDAPLRLPFDVAVDAKGAILIGEQEHIRRIDPSGIITTVVGAIDPGTMGARSVARLADPRAIASTGGMMLLAGGASGTLQALVGDVARVVAGRYPQDTATGQLARFRGRAFGAVGGVAYDAVGKQIFLTESTAHRIDVITTADAADPSVKPSDPNTWKIRPLAGAAAGYRNGPLASAQFRSPTGLFFDVAERRLYVADAGNHVVRVIDLAGGLLSATVGTIAGRAGTSGWAGDNHEAASALLFSPSAVTRCPNGDLFVADTGNHRVRRISQGTITTVLGNGSASSSGEGAPSSAFPVATPRGLGCDAAGNLFVTASTAVRMVVADAQRAVDGTGAVRTIYGLATSQPEFPTSATRCLSGLEVTDVNKVRVADACAGIMIELQRKARGSRSK
jgi:sugar lactone lactonase YvrE